MAKVKKAIKALKKSIPKSPAPSPKLRQDWQENRPLVKSRGPGQVTLPGAAVGGRGKIGRNGRQREQVSQRDIKRELREKLVRLRERLTGQINFLAADNLSRTQKDAEVDFRSEEQGTDNFDRDFALNRVSLEQDIVFEIDEALNRIKIGTYGACESCGGPIEKARMAALPYSRMCVGCQAKLETGRKKFRSFETAALFPNADKAVPEMTSEEE